MPDPTDPDAIVSWTAAGIAEFLRVRRKVDKMSGPGVANKPDSIYVGQPQPPRPAAPQPFDRVFLIKVTDPEAGGGKYAAFKLLPPTTVAAATGDLAEAEIGVTTGGTSVLALNVREVGRSTHDVSSGGYLPLIFLAVRIGATADGKPIVVFDGLQWADCTPPDGGGG